MKKVLFVFAVAAFTACGNGESKTENAVDSATEATKDMIDSTATAKKDMIDSSAEAKKAMVDSSAKMMTDTAKAANAKH